MEPILRSSSSVCQTLKPKETDAERQRRQERRELTMPHTTRIFPQAPTSHRGTLGVQRGLSHEGVYCVGSSGDASPGAKAREGLLPLLMGKRTQGETEGFLQV